MMTIRNAHPRDEATISSFNARMALETENLTLDPSTLALGVAAILADPAKGRYFVAEIAEQVVGQLMITYEWSDWRNGNIWWLQSVYVHPDHRRRGVFRALFRHAEITALTNGAVALRLYVHDGNGRAQQTYQSLGMKSAHYVVMEKPLTSRVGPSQEGARR
jgi:GNAT superfamily N-acetyltransferase